MKALARRIAWRRHIAFDQRHDDDACLKPGKPERELWKIDSEDDDPHDAAVNVRCRPRSRPPIGQDLGMDAKYLIKAVTDRDNVKQEKNRHDPDRDARSPRQTRFKNTAPKKPTRTSVNRIRDSKTKLCSTKGFSIMWAVSIGRRKRDRNNKARRDKPEQHKNEHLALPPGKSFSSIEIEPSPCGLSSATLLYIGSAPKA